MYINSILNFNRIFYLIRNEIASNYKKIFTVFGAVAGILFLNSISRFYKPSANTSGGWFGIILIIGGLIYTSNIFKDLHHPQKGIHYLMQPASITEKFLAKLLMVSAGYSLTVIVFMFLFSAMMSGLSLIFFGYGQTLFNPFTNDVGWMILNYIIIQSVFLLGSVYFKRSAFFKTILAIFIFIILIGLTGIFFIRIVYHDFFGKFITGGNMSLNFPEITGYFNDIILKYLPGIVKILYWFVMAPFFWIVTFFRLKETEV